MGSRTRPIEPKRGRRIDESLGDQQWQTAHIASALHPNLSSYVLHALKGPAVYVGAWPCGFTEGLSHFLHGIDRGRAEELSIVLIRPDQR
jgi:hypothetical protein